MVSASEAPGPIQQHPENPHYLYYLGEPTILLTSDHAYGAVVTRDFDYVQFLDTLAENGMNFTRIYPGAVPPIWFAEPTIFPWEKTADGRYDLDQWSDEYFRRLRGFVEHARENAIIVDVCFFNGPANISEYFPKWPLYPDNNLLGDGTYDCMEFCTLANDSLVSRQADYVRKITAELREFDNVVYDISDEPDTGSLSPLLFTPWLSKMLDECIAVDGDRHLKAITHAGANMEEHDFCQDPRTSWISLEYIIGIPFLETDYSYGKPLVLIETGCYCTQPMSAPGQYAWELQRTLCQYVGDAISNSRVECWEFLVGGGAGFMQFNFDYSRPSLNPTAAGTTTPAIFSEKRVLRGFMDSLDYIKMKPIVFGGKPLGAYARAMAEPGRQYAFYIHHSTSDRDTNPDFFWAGYTVVPGEYRESITFYAVPAGSYKVAWIVPATGESAAAPYDISHVDGDLTLTTPTYHVDLALRMTRE